MNPANIASPGQLEAGVFGREGVMSACAGVVPESGMLVDDPWPGYLNQQGRSRQGVGWASSGQSGGSSSVGGKGVLFSPFQGQVSGGRWPPGFPTQHSVSEQQAFPQTSNAQ